MSRDRGDRSAVGGRLVPWLLAEGDRRAVAGLLLAALFLPVLAVGLAVPPDRLAAGDPVETLFQALVGATVTGVTLVLTLNQVVLSQELGAVGDQRDRMEGSLSFRRDTEEHLDAAVAPTDPATFLGELIARATDRAQAVAADADLDDTDPAAREAVVTLVEAVEADAATALDRLDGAEFGSYDVVGAALAVDYSRLLSRARRLRATRGDAVDRAALEDLIATLELFGPAREHFKTLYFQWTLIDLSRAIVATALPSLVVAVAVLLYYGGPVAGVPAAVVLAAAVAVALSPFVVLLAYVLRIATVARNTLSIGPFVLDADDPGGPPGEGDRPPGSPDSPTADRTGDADRERE